MDTEETCPRCEGTGELECFEDRMDSRGEHYTRDWTERCDHCDGSGLVWSARHVEAALDHDADLGIGAATELPLALAPTMPAPADEGALFAAMLPHSAAFLPRVPSDHLTRSLLATSREAHRLRRAEKRAQESNEAFLRSMRLGNLLTAIELRIVAL